MNHFNEFCKSFQGVITKLGKLSNEKAPAIKRSRKKDPNAPKRPETSYIMFSREMRPRIVAKFPNHSNLEVMREMGRLWKELDEKTKEVYNKRYLEEKERYAGAIAEYQEHSHPESHESTTPEPVIIEDVTKAKAPEPVVPESVEPSPKKQKIEEVPKDDKKKLRKQRKEEKRLQKLKEEEEKKKREEEERLKREEEERLKREEEERKKGEEACSDSSEEFDSDSSDPE